MHARNQRQTVCAEDRFYTDYPCIILTAKGQPDVATRLFLRKLRMTLKLPVLALVDSDPYGLKILSAFQPPFPTIAGRVKTLQFRVALVWRRQLV